MAERCGERDVMITIKGFIRQKNKPIGKQYYLVLDNFKHDENNVCIYEEDLLAMLDRLMRAMDEPIMEDVDYSAVHEISRQLDKKCKEKSDKKLLAVLKEKGSNFATGIKNSVKGGKSTPNQVEMEEEVDEPTEKELLQKLARMEEERIQKEKEKEEKRCKARDDWFQAEQELVKEKAKYSKEKHIEQIFNEKVQPLVHPFLKLMESLIYFAGCLNSEDFSTRKRILLNRQRMICGSIQANGWDGILVAEAFQGVDEMLAAIAQEARIPDLPQISDQLTTEEYQQKKAKTEELKQKYLLENKKLSLNDIQQRKILEYICFFRELYPVIEKICAISESEIEEQWAISTGQEIGRLVDQYQARNSTMDFMLLYPDNAHIQSESVRIDFIAAEADCPGLYYKDSGGELICVIPGRIK